MLGALVAIAAAAQVLGLAEERDPENWIGPLEQALPPQASLRGAVGALVATMTRVAFFRAPRGALDVDAGGVCP